MDCEIMEHRHHGKSSETFLDSEEILAELNLKGDETFMDAGCGDGHIAIKAIERYLPEGTVYAVDAYDESIKELNDYINKNNFENLIAVEADITKAIPGVEDDSVDVALMVNVGFIPSPLNKFKLPPWALTISLSFCNA